MADWEFKSNTAIAKSKLDDLTYSVLAEVAGELVSATARNTRVKTGKTKGSWQYRISSDGDIHTATIGSPEQNAIWEEFGTGEHALNGDGRKGGWFYKDDEGKGHFTYGKKPTRAFWHAYTSLKNRIIKRIQSRIGGGFGK